MQSGNTTLPEPERERGDGGAPPSRSWYLGEAAQNDVDRALPVLGVGIGDVGEYAAFGCLLDEVGVGRMDEGDDRARGLVHDLFRPGGERARSFRRDRRGLRPASRAVTRSLHAGRSTRSIDEEPARAQSAEYSSFRKMWGSDGFGSGVRSMRKLKYGATNGSGAETVYVW
jgi:hypothetical protein